MPELEKDDEQAIATMQMGWNLLFQSAQLIAELPLEQWLEDFSRGEAVAPILDPTTFRDYMYSGKGDAIQRMINAALPLKREVERLRKDIADGKIKP